ncbi:hypothetical protein D3C81_1392060 [compost metagenome]
MVGAWTRHALRVSKARQSSSATFVYTTGAFTHARSAALAGAGSVGRMNGTIML